MATTSVAPPTSLIHRVHRTTPLTMVQPSDGDAGPWAALIQAHLANITTHKATLEALAHNMSAQQNLDETLVGNMEAMYSRTVEILKQAEGVQEYFGSLGPSPPQTNIQHGRTIRGGAAPTHKARKSSAEEQAAPKSLVGRRQHRDSSNDTSERGTFSKRRRVVDRPDSSLHAAGSQSAHESGVEYVDVSKEVLRRLAASRQRRMAKMASAPQGANTASRKRSRQSTGSEPAKTQEKQADTKPSLNKRLKSRPISNNEEIGTTEGMDGFASAEEDHTPGIPGAFGDSRDSPDSSKWRAKVKRSKSIV